MATYWVKTRTAPSSAMTVPTSSSRSSIFSERPRSLGLGWRRKWAGWLQICLRPVSSLSTRPRRVSSSASSMRRIDSRTSVS